VCDKPTSEDSEFERLKAGAVSPEYKRRKHELFLEQTTTLAFLLEPEVRQEFWAENLSPGENEIHTHTQELAQCVIANWCALLVRMKESKKGEPQLLGSMSEIYKPEPEDLYLGVQAFVVPAARVDEVFKKFWISLMKLGPVIEVAPNLFLAQTKGDYVYLVPTAQEAQNLTKTYPRYLAVD
jgi:hypothetical protein